MKNKILKIGTTSTTKTYVPLPWIPSNIYSGIAAAELAAFVLPKADEVAFQKAQELMEKDSLQVPIVWVDASEDLSKEDLQSKVAQAAQQYEEENIPGFLRDLINFADENPVSYTTPGHHNGQFYEKHPFPLTLAPFEMQLHLL